MDIYLIDGTYELFRYFYAVPSSKNASGQEFGAVRGVLGSILTMIEGGATHVGVATDHDLQAGVFGPSHSAADGCVGDTDAAFAKDLVETSDQRG